MKPQLTTKAYFATHRAACADAKHYALKFKTAHEAWQKCERADWMLWAVKQDKSLVNQIGKATFVGLAITFAERVLPNFEKKFPNNARPRKAIRAAKTWLKRKTKKNREAASAADAAYAASAAYTTRAFRAANAAERLWQAKVIRRAIKNPFK